MESLKDLEEQGHHWWIKGKVGRRYDTQCYGEHCGDVERRTWEMGGNDAPDGGIQRTGAAP